MSEVAADYYEEFFKEPNDIIRPHPYADTPMIDEEMSTESIPPATAKEVLEVVSSRKFKRSCDSKGLSNYMFRFLPRNYWSLLLQIFNTSFTEARFPDSWKEVKMWLLAKKESVCLHDSTRPISLLNTFLKIDEKLFLTRFQDLLHRRGLLPDSQSGFRQ
ncbi:unnamed protein product [Rotaria sp. Silwood2]|nr:unnamed protein product [Rotaria sp. Silwood2]CAF3105774.1 unnamed protein product [Rotaria sp. Silwood2]CAF3486243.1 unnamed protein product [Rotaria sp. Silwood2]CAF4431940.1 unnamed protein product [Rotaria sp. Silwood2]CAF4500249.1 unnamed protein product [Rotaria sp. Silwood2]